MSFRHGNLCLPTCLGRWHSNSSEDLTDLTDHVEWLRSDPADLAVAIAMYAMLLESRPSRMMWELRSQHRHVIGACAQQLHDGILQTCLRMEPNKKTEKTTAGAS